MGTQPPSSSSPMTSPGSRSSSRSPSREEGFRVVTGDRGEEAHSEGGGSPPRHRPPRHRHARPRRHRGHAPAPRAAAPVPVILLTAKGSTADKAKGLDLGADDYIAKPFHPDELAARVRAVIRRSSGRRARRRRRSRSTTSRSTSSGGWSRRNGELVQLSRTEWLLLQHLRRQRRQGRPPHRAPDQGLGPGVPRRPPVPAGLGQPRPPQARRAAGRAGPDQDVPGHRLPARTSTAPEPGR